MDIEIPADLTALDDTELAALAESLLAEFDRLHDAAGSIEDLAALADAIDATRSETIARETAAAEAETARADLAARVHGTSEAPPADDAAPDDAELVDAEAAVSAPPAPPTPAVVAAGGSTPPVRRPSAAGIAGRSPRPPAGRGAPAVAITAAADIPGHSSGSAVSLSQVASAMHVKAASLGNKASAVIASIARPVPSENMLTRDPSENMEIIKRVTGNRNAQALVASGGWCAPSVPLFELFEIGDAEGLIDLPSVGNATRGGFLVPTFYSFTDAAAALWTWTEADDITAASNDGTGDTVKPCMVIPCPTWTDYRLQAEGLCVSHGNLSDQAYPELTRTFLNVVMNAHEHRMSAAKIAKITAGATAVAITAAASDAAGDLLGALDLQFADYRSQYRVGKGTPIEVLFPDWVLPWIRTNMARRAGVDNMMAITDEQITSWFTIRGARPQFLSDYQALYTGTPKLAWGTGLEATIYYGGAYVEAQGTKIDLGVMRDAAQVETNDHTAAWSEEFYQVMRTGPLARKLTISGAIPDGVTACCA